MSKVIDYNKKISKIRKQKDKYLKEHSVKNLKAEYISCRKCGSKLKISLLKSDYCPLCNTDLKSKSVLEHIKEYDNKIKSLLEEKEDCENDLIRKEKGSFELRYNDKPKRESDKKILAYLVNIYGENFRGAECAEGKDYIFVSTKDYNHSQKYFSAWFDAYVFDKEGTLVRSAPKYVTGTAYSDFFIDKIEWKDNNFRIIVRSSIHSYSKCDDEFLAVWMINLVFSSNAKSIYVDKNPFIFEKRYSEREISVCNEKFSNDNGTYIIYNDKKGYSALELSLSSKLRMELNKEV